MKQKCSHYYRRKGHYRISVFADKRCAFCHELLSDAELKAIEKKVQWLNMEIKK